MRQRGFIEWSGLSEGSVQGKELFVRWCVRCVWYGLGNQHSITSTVGADETRRGWAFPAKQAGRGESEQVGKWDGETRMSRSSREWNNWLEHSVNLPYRISIHPHCGAVRDGSVKMIPVESE